MVYPIDYIEAWNARRNSYPNAGLGHRRSNRPACTTCGRAKHSAGGTVATLRSGKTVWFFRPGPAIRARRRRIPRGGRPLENSRFFCRGGAVGLTLYFLVLGSRLLFAFPAAESFAPRAGGSVLRAKLPGRRICC